MPVPVWACTDMHVSLDSVLSDDIWKKFDLDEPLDEQYIYAHQNGGSMTSTGGVIGNGNGTSDKSMMTTMMMSGINNNNNNNNNNNSMNNGVFGYDENTNNQAISLAEFNDKISCRESREIRHHDCMWAGLCISKEHNRTLPAKKEAIVNSKKVPAGRSLLISSRTTSMNTGNQANSAHYQRIQNSGQQQSLYQQQQQQRRNQDGLESDGDSARPETPQSSESENEEEEDEEEEEEEEEEEDELESKEHIERIQTRNSLGHIRIKQEIEDVPLIFKHDQISINDKLSECMSDDTSQVVRSAPVSEVTGQVVKKSQHHHHTQHHRHNYPHHHHQTNVNVKIEPESEQWTYDPNEQQQQQQRIVVKNEPDNWNTLNDHCYHQPSSKKLEHLGVQTPSDSEEEIDVVTFEKPCRPAALPTYPSIADQQHFQLTVKSALKEKPVTAPRPRGRPPSNGTPRKRSAPNDTKPTKRAKHRAYQSRSKVTKNNAPPTPAASPLKSSSPIGTLQTSAGPTSAPGTSRSSSSDDEPDTEKRSLHNNMERQRRIELRNAFEDLRLLVPEIEDKEKAPKVAILRQAAIYCDKLTEIDRATNARVIEMKRRQERLRARLSQLRRSLAMTR